jgi:uncharacterized protein (DUF1330 family)
MLRWQGRCPHQFGARLLVSPGSGIRTVEAGLKQITVVVEFDSYKTALVAHLITSGLADWV